MAVYYVCGRCGRRSWVVGKCFYGEESCRCGGYAEAAEGFGDLGCGRLRSRESIRDRADAGNMALEIRGESINDGRAMRWEV